MALRMATVASEIDKVLRLAEYLGIAVCCGNRGVRKEEVTLSGYSPFPSPSRQFKREDASE